MYHLISHVVYQNDLDIYGPVHVLASYLRSKKQKVQLFFLPLFLEGKYQVITPKKTYAYPSTHTSMVKKFFYDVRVVFQYIFRYPIPQQDVVVAVDPLNCFPFALWKLVKPFRLIYYTADYADKRFDQPILEFIYQFLDWFCLTMCQQNWCVSERIVEKRKEQGFGRKAVFLPNTPVLPGKPAIQDIKRKDIVVYVGRLDENMNLSTLLEAIKLLKKKNSKVQLHLIGGGPLHAEIETYIRKNELQKNVFVHGPLPNDQVIQFVRKSGIGIALYSGGNNWNNYGDSMKIREYQYFGLPVITTTIPSNAKEITEFECGYVFEPEKVTTAGLLKALQDIETNYQMYTANTVELAKQRMKNDFLKRMLGV